MRAVEKPFKGVSITMQSFCFAIILREIKPITANKRHDNVPTLTHQPVFDCFGTMKLLIVNKQTIHMPQSNI